MQENSSKIYKWAIEKANSKASPFWIGLLFFLEITLFLPLDAVLMFFCLQNRKQTGSYVLLATITSTISGFMGYLIGHFLWDLIGGYIVPGLISTNTFENTALQFQKYEAWAIFVGALLPFPIKVLTVSAGVFQLGVAQFLSYFFFARMIRFGIIGACMLIWGDKIKSFLERHFSKVVVLLGAKIAAALAIFWSLAQ